MILIQLCWFYDSIASDSMFSFWLYSVCSHKRWQTTRPLVRTQRAATRTGRRSGTMALSLWATSPESCKFSPLLFTSPSVLFQLDLFICVFEIDIIISVCLFYLRPAVQSSSESYGGLTEDSLGDAYNASKDGTLVMREVTNAPLHTHTHCLFLFKLSSLYLPVCWLCQLGRACQAEEKRRGGHTESNGFGNHSNIGNLPDLVQQSNSPSATPTTTLQELGDLHEVRCTLLSYMYINSTLFHTRTW